MSSDRPNPDELLARVQSEEAHARRGRLKIFFGYAAGVGKTYAMLTAARREKAEGVDVVVGYVEPHGRPETEALLEGLETIPTRPIEYRGVTVREFDLDAALARKPKLLLVDELAHTNAEGSRHAKRWNDVEELLEAGIDVYTTLNVQHLESLNDVIAQISSVIVRETLPDAVLEKADELELIDLTPEELMERLRAGKVYLPVQAERALENFFKKGNLAALRELSLREAARRLSKDVDTARQQMAATAPWATGERLLVCVSPSPTSSRLIRRARRMAAASGSEWLAVAVDTGGTGAASDQIRAQIARHLRFAEELGAESHTLVGRDVASTIVEYARARNVTRIIVGKTLVPRWRRLFFKTVVDALLELSGDIDVYVVRGAFEGQSRPTLVPTVPQPAPWDAYIWTAVIVSLCGLCGWLIFSLHLAEANIVMAFLLGVAIVAIRFGRGPAIAAAIASVLVFDFFFVPPRFSFAVSDTQYVITFGVMLAIGLLISTLTARGRERLYISQQLEHRTNALYQLTRQLSEIAGVDFLAQTAGKRLQELFGGEVVIYLREPDGQLSLRFGEGTAVAKHETNSVVARWVAEHDRAAGNGTDTLPSATAMFLPLTGSQRTVGAVGVRPSDPQRLLHPDQRQLLETCASMIALSIERDQSVLEAHQAQLQVETEQLRNSLLSSVSHDLRTPLATIAGASSSLLDAQKEMSVEERRELLQSIVEESQRLARLVDNLLDMTRLEAGTVTLNKQWHVLEEIIGSALVRLRRELARHEVHVAIPDDFPLLWLDGVLMEQVFVNLFENASRYTPPGSRIDVTARKAAGFVEVTVSDNGPGLPAGNESQVFEKFFRGSPLHPDARRGVGLGLAICRGLVRAHGGELSARNRPEGGAEFIITLPCLESAPRVALDESPIAGGTEP
jgi:two-component system sensor histidine kinase KdpD